jgi:hypothetical protein
MKPCPERSLVAEHFRARLGPRDTARMRAHLDACEVCRALYRRHLLLERVDPKAPGPKARIAAGLGVALPRPRRAPWRWAVPSLAFACLVVLVVASALKPRPPDDDGFVARGGPSDGAVIAYAIRGGEKPARVSTHIRPNDALAFAYTNPRGHKRLMIFAVDEQRRVYWYHPAWTDAADNPVAIPIDSGPSLRELPDAVTHRFTGKRLDVWALFRDEPTSVREVEAHVADGTLSTWAKPAVRMSLTVD